MTSSILQLLTPQLMIQVIQMHVPIMLDCGPAGFIFSLRKLFNDASSPHRDSSTCKYSAMSAVIAFILSFCPSSILQFPLACSPVAILSQECGEIDVNK